MSTRRWLAIGGALVVVIFVALAVSRQRAVPPTPPVGYGGLVPPATYTTPPTISPPATDRAVLQTASPSPTLPATSPTALPTASPASPAMTPPSHATGDPRAAFAEFLLRVNDDRTTVERLNRSLAGAAEAQDPDAVRLAAVAILDFVDAERDWLREHPPADCYADAHAAANAMLERYGTAADRFVTWASSDGGLAGLDALGEAIDAAQTASDALTTFGTVLGATRCPT